jgi:hypothetical protein
MSQNYTASGRTGDRRPRRRLAGVEPLLLIIVLLGPTGPAVAAGRVLPSVHSRVKPEDVPRPPEVPDDATLESDGARIGRVVLKPIQVFDT